MANSQSLAKAASADVVLIDPDQTLKASKALLAHIKKAAKQKEESSGKKNILDDPENDELAAVAETPIWLAITTKRHIADSSKLKPTKITLPHSLNTDPTASICLITADPQRAYKNLVAHEDFPEDLRKRITRVIDFGKLKAKFRQYESQRKLLAEHDIFLADDRIINRLPKTLGKTFFKATTKRPIPVLLRARQQKVDGKRVKRPAESDAINAASPQEIAAEINKAIGAALLHLSPSNNTAIRVAFANWSAEDVAENIAAAATAVVEKHIPQKWKNMKSIYIKGPETAALPIWLTEQLWLEDADVVPDAQVPGEDAAEKPNVGKKRKSIAAPAADDTASQRKTKKAKGPEQEDLESQIAERKTQLKKKKAAAKKKMDA